MARVFIVCADLPDQRYLGRVAEEFERMGHEPHFVVGAFCRIVAAIEELGMPDLVIFRGDGVTSYMKTPAALRQEYPTMPMLYFTITTSPRFDLDGIWVLYLPVFYMSDGSFWERFHRTVVEALAWGQEGEVVPT